MSVMNFQSTFRDVKPPDKGSFPLDHDGGHCYYLSAGALVELHVTREKIHRHRMCNQNN